MKLVLRHKDGRAVLTIDAMQAIAGYLQYTRMEIASPLWPGDPLTLEAIVERDDRTTAVLSENCVVQSAP
jgi:hypothetical protein